MAMYLSRLTLRQDPSTVALKSLIDPVGAGDKLDAHHRLLWSIFSDSPERKRDFIWRAERNGRFYALSCRPPVSNGLFEPVEYKEFTPELRSGDELEFVLRANAVRSLSEKWTDTPTKLRPRGKKVDVAMHLLKDLSRKSNMERGAPSERAAARYSLARNTSLQWLTAQGERHGFEVIESNFVLNDYSTVEISRTKRKNSHALKFGIFDMSGRLLVRKPDAFVYQIGSGFGRAKAFGQGLMMVKRV